MESPAGNIPSTCHYADGFCPLEDESMLEWNIKREVKCSYLPWVNLTRKYHDGFFVSTDFNIALTLTTGKEKIMDDCSEVPIYT